jgi:hypothetical protein
MSMCGTQRPNERRGAAQLNRCVAHCNTNSFPVAFLRHETPTSYAEHLRLSSSALASQAHDDPPLHCEMEILHMQTMDPHGAHRDCVVCIKRQRSRHEFLGGH